MIITPQEIALYGYKRIIKSEGKEVYSFNVNLMRKYGKSNTFPLLKGRDIYS